MESETANGLHFPAGHYSPIRRTSSLTAQAEGFEASNGQRALKFVDAHQITATFDPWGVFIRQWRFSEIHVESGEIEIQIYEANPEQVTPKPWFTFFLPNRVYIKRIQSEHTNVAWQFRGERAGLFGTQLLITPHGRDFNYAAAGGKLKMALLPELYLHRANVLITKTLVTVNDIDLTSDETNKGSVRGKGTAGLGKDRSIDFGANFESVPIRGWLPYKWKEHFSGNAYGSVHWMGVNPKLENSSGEGSLRVQDAQANNLPFLEKLAQLAHEKSFEHLELTDCSLDLPGVIRVLKSKSLALKRKGSSASREQSRLIAAH